MYKAKNGDVVMTMERALPMIVVAVEPQLSMNDNQPQNLILAEIMEGRLHPAKSNEVEHIGRVHGMTVTKPDKPQEPQEDQEDSPQTQCNGCEDLKGLINDLDSAIRNHLLNTFPPFSRN